MLVLVSLELMLIYLTVLYEKFTRKFTLVPFGGFDGWDVYNSRRTNTDKFIIMVLVVQLGCYLVDSRIEFYLTVTWVLTLITMLI
jgi:hypothetical protein